MIYEFTEEELNTNKRGLFSPGQRKMIEGLASGYGSMQWGNLKIAVVFLFIVFSVMTVITLQNEGMKTAILADPVFLIVLASGIFFLFGIFAFSIVLANWNGSKLKNARLLTDEGIVELDVVRSKYGTTYYLILGKIKFAFARDISRFFRDGEGYRVYYCETASLKLVMSYERIL